MAFHVRALDDATWPEFARLVEAHNGVWGGCWCVAFHAEGVGFCLSDPGIVHTFETGATAEIAERPWRASPVTFVCRNPHPHARRRI